MPPSKVKAEVYVILGNLMMKSIATFVALAAFIWVLYEFLYTDTLEARISFGLFDTFLGGTIIQVFKHFFPTKKN